MLKRNDLHSYPTHYFIPMSKAMLTISLSRSCFSANPGFLPISVMLRYAQAPHWISCWFSHCPIRCSPGLLVFSQHLLRLGESSPNMMLYFPISLSDLNLSYLLNVLWHTLCEFLFATDPGPPQRSEVSEVYSSWVGLRPCPPSIPRPPKVKRSQEWLSAINSYKVWFQGETTCRQNGCGEGLALR